MPWNQTCPMDEKIKFIAAVKSGQDSFAEICRQFGISRKSGYKLMQRYEQDGEQGLKERSRAPHRHPNAISQAMAADPALNKRIQAAAAAAQGSGTPASSAPAPAASPTPR